MKIPAASFQQDRCALTSTIQSAAEGGYSLILFGKCS